MFIKKKSDMKTIQLISLFFLMMCIQSANAQLWMDADVNKDRTLDAKDIQGIINTMAGDITYIGTADVNKDGKIDIVDLVAAINVIRTEDAAVRLGICPDRYHPHLVDMGAAGKWACCNMGASLPWNLGLECAWGDPQLHYPSEWEGNWDNNPFEWDHYPNRDETSDDYGVKDIGNDIAQTQYDVATVNWGTTWCMPNDEQILRLLNLPYEWSEIEGRHVRKITAPNGNVLYLNADDFITYYTSEYKTDRLWGYYNYGKWIEDWYEVTGYVAYAIAYFYDPIQSSIADYSYVKHWEPYPWYAHYVRPIVCEPKPLPDEAVLAGYCPDKNHPHVIDLGSGGKWSCCNVGASAPWETGGYYCWGGTKELTFYGATPENETACVWGTLDDGSEWWGYKWKMWDDRAVLLPGYDVAHTQWGGTWHMPMMEYWEKLNSSGMTKEATKLNGTPGLKITASNGNRIFLPYCGRKAEASFYYDEYNPMEYWTATSITDFQGECLESDAAACHHNYWYDPIAGHFPEDSNTDFVQVHQARGTGLPVRAIP